MYLAENHSMDLQSNPVRKHIVVMECGRRYDAHLRKMFKTNIWRKPSNSIRLFSPCPGGNLKNYQLFLDYEHSVPRRDPTAWRHMHLNEEKKLEDRHYCHLCSDTLPSDTVCNCCGYHFHNKCLYMNFRMDFYANRVPRCPNGDCPDSNTPSCIICHEDMPASRTIVLQCGGTLGHAFCEDCINTWVGVGTGGCPYCRAAVEPRNLTVDQHFLRWRMAYFKRE